MPKTSAPAPMTSARASLIRGITTVEPRIQSEYLKPGEYVLTLLGCKEGQTRAPANRPFFVVEAKVVGADPDTLAQGGNKVGHTVSWMVMLDNDAAMRDVRGFLDVALTDEELASLSDETVAECTGPSQLLKGRTLQVAAENITTKRGTPFTRVRWFRYEQA